MNASMFAAATGWPEAAAVSVIALCIAAVFITLILKGWRP